ncbi:MAG: cupredoxin domain-containing protein [Planctomycetota bacterium]
MRGLRWLPFLPQEAGPVARDVDAAFLALLALTGGIALAVLGAVGWFAWRYRAGSAVARPAELRHPRRIELGCLALLILTSFATFAATSPVYTGLFHPPPPTLKLEGLGKQWMWKFRHPDGRREVNELHVPAGEPVTVVLSSQDVIHSLYLPALRLKQDVLPGRRTRLSFVATRPGRYPLLCAEYCGTEHALMQGELVVLEPEAFARWQAAAPEEPPGAREPDLYSGDGPFVRHGCATCHRTNSDRLAPRLDGLWGREVRLADGRRLRADEAYLKRAILEPAAELVAGYEDASPMPRYAARLDAGEVAALLRFLRAARDGWPPTEEPR